MILINQLEGDVKLGNAKKLEGDVSPKSVSLNGNITTSYMPSIAWGKITGDIENQTDLYDLLKPEVEVLGIPFNTQWELDIQNPWYWKLTSMEYIDPQTGVSHYYSAEEMIEMINTKTIYLRFYTLVGLSYGFGDYYNFEYYNDLDGIIGKSFDGTASNIPVARFKYMSPDFKNSTATLYLASSDEHPQDRHFLDEAYAMIGEHDLIEATQEDIDEMFERYGE